MNDPRAGATHQGTTEIAVIGGGVIGLATAWRLAQRGHEVTVIDAAPGAGASWVAGGMLASTCEVGFAERHSAGLLFAAAEKWPGFLEELAASAKLDLRFSATRSILVGFDRGDRSAIGQLTRFQQDLGLEATPLASEELRRLVPLLSPRLEGGVLVETDRAVDNRQIVTALLAATKSAAVRFINARASKVTSSASGLVVHCGTTTIAAANVIIAVGANEHHLTLPTRPLRLRPVKGQILRLSSPTGVPPIDVVVRAHVRGRSCYLVPRHDGSLVIGATVSEQGFDRRIETGAVFSLLDDARSILPIVDEMGFDEAAVGFRPSTISGDPEIGWTDVDGLAVALGHYRNGFLLAPLTADHLCALIEGGTGEPTVLPYGFAR